MPKSDDLDIQRGERLHELRTELVKLAMSATEHFFVMGSIMKEVRDDELWKDSHESFREFYADPELGFKKSSVNHAIRLVELFPEWRKFLDIHVSKLIMIAPHVDEKNRNELVNMARSLSTSDLHHQLTMKRLVEKSPRVEPLAKIYPCDKCHKARGITFDGLCHCGWTPKQVEYISKLIEKVNDGSYEI